MRSKRSDIWFTVQFVRGSCPPGFIMQSSTEAGVPEVSRTSNFAVSSGRQAAVSSLASSHIRAARRTSSHRARACSFGMCWTTWTK